MTNSVPVQRPADKDRKGRFAVPPSARAFFVPKPGPHLARFIQDGRRAGRPCLHVPDGLVVPAALNVPDGLVVPALHGIAFNRPPPPATMPRAVLVAIRWGDPDAAWLAIENQRNAATLRRLIVATQRDILALTIPEITELFEYSDASSTRRTARQGRVLWRKLGAWPWCDFGERLDYSEDWWQHEGTVERLLDWRTGLS